MLLLIQEIMKNLPEFKKLIIRYETITIEEIEAKYKFKKLLTGFGDYQYCTLCISAGYDGLYNAKNCIKCVWGYALGNFETKGRYRPCYGEPKSKTEKTMRGISYAQTHKELLTAYRNRAKHMRSILKKLNIEMP